MPLLDRSVWEAAQAQLASNRQGYTMRRAVPSASLLAGLVVDVEGHRLIPSHSQKQSRRYRYYVSEPLVKGIREDSPEGMRIPAAELEARVIEVLVGWLDDEHAVLEALTPPAEAVQRILERARQVRENGVERHDGVRRLIASAIVATDSIEVAIDPTGPDSHAGRKDTSERPLVRRSVSVRIKRCGFAMRLLVAGQSVPARQRTRG